MSAELEQGLDDVSHGIDEIVREHMELRETLRWVIQTVHQGHHDQPLEACQRNTCKAVRDVFQRIPQRHIIT